MRILLDESIPRNFRESLTGHHVLTVGEIGWAGKKNGDLLRDAASTFDVFITMDRQLPFQQSLASVDLAIVVLLARSNQLEDLLPAAPRVLAMLPSLEPGRVIQLQA